MVPGVFLIADNHPLGPPLYWTGKLALVVPAVCLALGTLGFEAAKRIERWMIEHEKRNFLNALAKGPEKKGPPATDD
jgi:hypothetical protein